MLSMMLYMRGGNVFAVKPRQQQNIKLTMGHLENTIYCSSDFDSAPWTSLSISFPSDFVCASGSSHGHRFMPLMLQDLKQWSGTRNNEMLSMMLYMRGGNAFAVKPRQLQNTKLTMGHLENTIYCSSDFDSAPWTSLSISFPSDFVCASGSIHGHRFMPLMLQALNIFGLPRLTHFQGDLAAKVAIFKGFFVIQLQALPAEEI
ncbi:hypothetical protein NDU88_001249 [Pleurodeles waltl]|uniref:Uncharacterized protein n=1 Tax=Pleurodeles waltl TaxID=8319 RepID=A0AAV7S7I4_PLEWA|nr:hypothetical protein NDU88_001249 [Pleurodeles waltl]